MMMFYCITFCIMNMTMPLCYFHDVLWHKLQGKIPQVLVVSSIIPAYSYATVFLPQKPSNVNWMILPAVLFLAWIIMIY